MHSAFPPPAVPPHHMPASGSFSRAGLYTRCLAFKAVSASRQALPVGKIRAGNTRCLRLCQMIYPSFFSWRDICECMGKTEREDGKGGCSLSSDCAGLRGRLRVNCFLVESGSVASARCRPQCSPPEHQALHGWPVLRLGQLRQRRRGPAQPLWAGPSRMRWT